MLLYCLSKVVSTSASKLRTDVGDGPNPTFSVHQTGISLPLPLRPLSVSDVVGLAGHPKHKNHSTHKLYDHLYAKGFMHEDGRGPVTRPAKNRDKHARQKEAKREGKANKKYHKLKGNMKRMLDSLKKFGFEEKPLYKNISTLRHNMMDGMAAWTKSPSDKRKDAAGAKKTAYEEAHCHF